MRLAGCFTAIATPFRDGAVDFESLGRLIDLQIDGGVAGIVPCGTTGESPTLSVKEHDAVVQFSVERAKGRCAVFAGTGSNATNLAIERTKAAKAAGATGALLATPAYNKPTQEGLFRHYEAIVRGVPGFPVVLYEVPGRTCVSLDVETCARLCVFDEVIAIKEASGKLERVTRLRQTTDLAILSGDDAMTLPMISLGATGVVSVASNVVPGDVSALVTAATDGDFAEALRLHDRLDPLFTALFLETNPGPVKYALERCGVFTSGEPRLPLVAPGEKARKAVDAVLARLGCLAGAR